MRIQKNDATVAIVGVGLIGGSFGLALRTAGFRGELLGVSSPAALEAGLRIGAISRKATLQEAAAHADLIYLAQPVDRILLTLRELGPLIRSGCLVTDAGSTKMEIVQTAAQSLPPRSFLGGHPMAGKERRGVEAADPELFRGRPYVLTPDPEAPPELFGEFRDWLRRFGAHIVEMSPAEHDATIAFTSHLPQLLSVALANSLGLQNNTYLERVFGPGLLDMTRLALSDFELWESIIASNKQQILLALEAFQSRLQALEDALQSNYDMRLLFSSAAEFAKKIRKIENS
jgi:prephenate dehydrogenase